MQQLRVVLGGTFIVLLIVVPIFSQTSDSCTEMCPTNLTQLAEEAFSGSRSIYLPDTAWEWQAYPTDDGQPWWVDCSQWPCLGLSPASTNVNGVALFTLWLTKNVLTGETIVQSVSATDIVARIEAPSDYQPGANVEDRGVWYMWQQVTNCPECWGIEGEIPPPTVSLKVFLADVQNTPIWDEAVAAQEAAWERAESIRNTFLMAATYGDVSAEGVLSIDPCAISNSAQPFSIIAIQHAANHYTTVTWESCTNFLYGVLSTEELTTNTSWLERVYLWGLANASSWTDTTTTNIDRRFYKVLRKPPLVTVAAGGSHSLLTRIGTVWGWGGNAFGQIGGGNIRDQYFPKDVRSLTCCGLSNVVALAAGAEHSVAVDVYGNTWTFGWGGYGQLGNGASSNLFIPYPILGVSNVIGAAAGELHTLALRTDGTVFTWGSDDSGQLGVGGLPSPHLTNSPVRTLILTQIVAIAAGGAHSMAVHSNGNVYTWGYGYDGELGNGGATNVSTPTLLTTISNVIAIAAGYYHTIAVKSNGTLWTWGANDSGQLGRNGNSLLPGQVTNLSSVVSVAAGFGFSLAVISNGDVYAWGDNSRGQLGTGGTLSLSTPTKIASISNAVLVSASELGFHSLAVTFEQGRYRYWAWGANSNGQIGDGGTVDRTTPELLQFSRFCPDCSCIQLGTNGTFTAQCTGTLKLYFNDNVNIYGDNSGSYTVNIEGYPAVVVPANAVGGVTVGVVSNGVSYNFSASGFCTNCTSGSCFSNPSGLDQNGNLRVCGSLTASFLCPDARCLSLVGKIEETLY